MKESRQSLRFSKYGRTKERSEKKTKMFNIFWKKKRKKEPSRKNKTMFCQNVKIIGKKKKHFQKRIVKH